MRADYEKQLFADNDIFIVSGHTPTQLLSGKAEIYRSHNNIDIDCGAAFGGRLACLRLDDMTEFYV
jgi:serine/threonine protein phosphatase 1